MARLAACHVTTDHDSISNIQITVWNAVQAFSDPLTNNNNQYNVIKYEIIVFNSLN